MYGFTHFVVNHLVYIVSKSGIHTELIEFVWNRIKSSLKLKRGTKRVISLVTWIIIHFYEMPNIKKSLIDFFIELIQTGDCYL